ncbi:PQQ-binding-like beta-propeller repeat protein [Streptomyces sp. SID5910]|uniref:outer membrane protein assembly factor BamB family protein n=1 Tax=Streptomyces sp. SID5910 TaxID=2690312 RepID=UPI001371C8FC|nr:PQQ-binding-like beta-propeller repeat protein [Streptomyces sp. SID5910]MYR45882.1 PQQ-binding-like beta-propeller repeat protein [Streptomyces sp. SID5910]
MFKVNGSRRLILVAGLALALTTACGSSGGDGGPQRGTSPSSSADRRTPAPAKAYDPPLKFAEGLEDRHYVAGGTGEGKWSVSLEGTTVFAVSDDELRAMNALNGEELWSVKPQGTLAEDTDYGTEAVGSPELIDVDGKTAVLAAFSITEPGTGTVPDRALLELTAVAADSGKRLWTTQLERPEGEEEGEPYVAGASDSAVVLSFGGNGSAVTMGVSLTTRKASWTEKGFYADFVDAGIVVGRGGADSVFGGGMSVEGRRIDDGSTAWTYKDHLNSAELAPAGGGLFTADVDAPFEQDADIATLLTTATGKSPAGFQAAAPFGHPTDLTCWAGEGTALLCEVAEKFDKKVVAVSPGNWKELWSVTDEDESRLMPSISTVFHGAVYGSTENGSVILDARTGKDKAASSEGTPFTVNEYLGLFSGSLSGIEARPATG